MLILVFFGFFVGQFLGFGSFVGSTLGDFFFEFVDSSFDVNEFLLAGEERVTLVANLDFDFVESGAGGEFVATGTGYLTIVVVVGMN